MVFQYERELAPHTKRRSLLSPSARRVLLVLQHDRVGAEVDQVQKLDGNVGDIVVV